MVEISTVLHVRPLDGRDVGGEFGDKEPGILQGNGAGGEVNHLFYEIKPTKGLPSPYNPTQGPLILPDPAQVTPVRLLLGKVACR